MSKRVLITGMSGHVGSHLYEHIMVNTDWTVVGIDRLGDTTLHGFDRVVESKHYDKDRTTLLTYDLTRPIGKGMLKELGEIHIIYHVASASHVDNSIKGPREFINNNINLQVTMLELAKTLYQEKTLELFYMFSTDETYGPITEGFYKEGDRHNTGNVYSASKSAQEMLCRAYANTYKIPIVISCCMNIIAEKQHPEKFLPKIISLGLKDHTVMVHTDNKGNIGTRFYIHARDVADAVLFITKHAPDRLNHLDASLGVYNIPGVREVSNLELVMMVSTSMNKEIQVDFIDSDLDRPGVDIRYALDGTKLKALGWEPPQDLEVKIQNIVDWTLQPENKKWLNH